MVLSRSGEGGDAVQKGVICTVTLWERQEMRYERE